jgi:hypothetical protein
MGAYLHWKKKTGGEITLWFDVVTEESHTYQSAVTKNPVEEGPDVTDHIRPELGVFTLNGFISNQPIYTKSEIVSKIKTKGKVVGAHAGAVKAFPLDVEKYEPPLAPTPGALLNALTSAIGSLFGGKKEYSASVVAFDESFDALQEVYQELFDAHFASQIVEVITSTRTVEKCAISNFAFTRDAGTGNGATVSLELTEIRTVQVSNAIKVPALQSGFPVVNKGKKGPEKADAKTSSTLFKGLGAAAAFAGVPGGF